MYVILHHNSSNRALRRRGFVSYFISVIPPVEFLILALVSVTAFVFQVESVYSNMMLCRLCQESSSVSFTLKEWFTKKQNKLHLIFLMLLQTFIFFSAVEHKILKNYTGCFPMHLQLMATFKFKKRKEKTKKEKSKLTKD